MRSCFVTPSSYLVAIFSWWWKCSVNGLVDLINKDFRLKNSNALSNKRFGSENGATNHFFDVRSSQALRKQKPCKNDYDIKKRKKSRHFRSINQSSVRPAVQAASQMIYIRPTTCVHVIIIIITAFFDTYLKAIGAPFHSDSFAISIRLPFEKRG